MTKYKRIFRSELTVSCESNNKSKSYLSVLLSIVVLLLISSMIVAAIVIISPEIATFPAKHIAPREAITLEEALLHELSPNDFAFQWLQDPKQISTSLGDQLDAKKATFNGDELLFEDAKNINIVAMPTKDHLLYGNDLSDSNNDAINQTTNQKRHQKAGVPIFKPKVITLVSNSSLLSSIDYQGYKISPSKRYLLIWTNKKRLFRHTFTARYFIYDIKLDMITLLSTQLSTNTQSLYSPTNQLYNSYENLDSATSYISGGSSSHQDNEFTRFQLVDWFSNKQQPELDSKDSLVLIQNNDIYLLDDVSGSDAPNVNYNSNLSSTRQLIPQKVTFTGKINEIFNGIPDWLYEEEILADTPAFQVSPNGQSLAYMSFNDSLVSLMPYTIYGGSEQVIPRVRQIRYPKAGRVNPRVSVHIIDNLSAVTVHQHQNIQLQLPDDLSRRQHYINRIQWLSHDHLSLIWLNRNQNDSYVLICSRNQDWKCRKNLHMSSPDGWLDVGDDLIPLNDEYYLMIMPKFESDQLGSFKHIARVSLSADISNSDYEFITSGPKEVISINGIDPKRNLVYYTSTLEGEPGQRQMFMANLMANATDGQLPASVCVTCQHHPEECLYNYAKMSPSTSYYVFECAGPGIPRTELRTTLGMSFGVPTSGGSGPLLKLIGGGDSRLVKTAELEQEFTSLLWTIEDNHELALKLKLRKVMPLTMRLKVPIPNTNYTANVLMLLPPQLGPLTTFRGANPIAGSGGSSHQQSQRPRRGANPRHSTHSGLEQPLHAYFTKDNIKEYTDQMGSEQQYPMVVDVYGGPNSQKVDYRFNIYFGHYLASSRRTVYAMIDGRGSGFEGTKRSFELRHALGTVEIQDQIEVANYLAQNFSFIQANKVAIWGWSYGGYAAAMALAQSNAKAAQRMHDRSTSIKFGGESVAAFETINSTTTTTTTTANNNGVEAPFLQPRLGSAVPNPSSAVMLNPLNGVFECAASVAPVTSWIYYDTAYTERYMSSPYANELYDDTLNGDHTITTSASHDGSADTLSAKLALDSTQKTMDDLLSTTNKWTSLNKTISSYTGSSIYESPVQSHQSMATNPFGLNERYRKASLLGQIDSINRKRFLLIHGTADDNVHFQQSIMLMKQLIKKNVLFESRLYPDQDHGIANKADKLHLGATLSNFFAECFDMAY